MRTLTPASRRALRAKAHHLHPVVSIGQHGLTPAVLHEIDVNLRAHELIKIRVFGDDRSERERLLAQVCADLDAAPVQHLGKTLTVWRPASPPEPEAVAPRSGRRDREIATNEAAPAARRTPSLPRTGSATAATRAPRRGRSVVVGTASAKGEPRRGARDTGAKPSSLRPPPPHGKSASSRIGASGARRRRKSRS